MRELLSYLPATNREQPPYRPTLDDAAPRGCRASDHHPQTIPTSLYDMRGVVTRIVDDGRFVEADGISLNKARMGPLNCVARSRST